MQLRVDMPLVSTVGHEHHLLGDVPGVNTGPRRYIENESECYGLK